MKQRQPVHSGASACATVSCSALQCEFFMS
jgi:hypothetical protein